MHAGLLEHLAFDGLLEAFADFGEAGDEGPAGEAAAGVLGEEQPFAVDDADDDAGIDARIHRVAAGRAAKHALDLVGLQRRGTTPAIPVVPVPGCKLACHLDGEAGFAGAYPPVDAQGLVAVCRGGFLVIGLAGVDAGMPRVRDDYRFFACEEIAGAVDVEQERDGVCAQPAGGIRGERDRIAHAEHQQRIASECEHQVVTMRRARKVVVVVYAFDVVKHGGLLRQVDERGPRLSAWCRLRRTPCFAFLSLAMRPGIRARRLRWLPDCRR